MPSSGSTPKPPRNRAPRLLIVLAGEDHPKACTGRRLVRWGRAVRVPRADAGSPTPVVLDPYAPTPLSARDRTVADRGGLLVVDCSWNRLADRGSFPGGERPGRRAATHRRLPALIATNPQHYGRVAQLNTAEAFSAALYILDRPEAANEVMAGFAGGDEFLAVNRDRLERYRRAATPSEVRDAEKALFGGT
jgi:rRNA small subunit aminocarboxypropyltransferase